MPVGIWECSGIILIYVNFCVLVFESELIDCRFRGILRIVRNPRSDVDDPVVETEYALCRGRSRAEILAVGFCVSECKTAVFSFK